MSFQSFSFWAFLIVTLAVCLPLARKQPTAAKLCLTVACLVFYVLGANWSSFAVLCVGALVSFFTVRQLQVTTDPKRRKLLFGLAVGYHIAVLLIFKYTGFFTAGKISVDWIPLGLSFFTFQQLWLLKEVFTGQFQLETPREFPLYAFFFPTVTSGPILRPSDLFSQVSRENFLRPTWEDAAAGLYGICCGTMKKVLLADSFGVVVGNGWERLDKLSAPGAWIVILGYALQLYFDFSGYCDIATGIARLFGIRLPVNFNSPYRALSVTDFWKRWHMTLTTFLRECLYFPLGGSRRGTVRTYCNIMIVFLVSGFWHGVGWTFLFWGALHGLGQVFDRLLGKRQERVPKWIRWALTFLFVNLTWIFFRAPDLASGMELLEIALTGGFSKANRWLVAGLFGKEAGAMQILVPALKNWIDFLRIGLLYGIGILVAFLPQNAVAQMEQFRPKWWQGIVLVVFTAWSILSFSGIATFIYSNF